MKGQGSRAPVVTLLGLAEFVVLAAGEAAGEVELLVETTETVTGCRRCGVVAEPHGRRPVTVRDLPIAGRPTVLVWVKRSWRCIEPACPQRTWSEDSAQIRPRSILTERARRWAMLRVGAHGETVAGVARQLGVGWHTVMRAVREHGQPLVDGPGPLAEVSGLGVDEHVGARWAAPPDRVRDRRRRPHPGPAAAAARRRARPHRERLRRLDPGRGDEWRQQIKVAALDPFRGYVTALSATLPDAVRVLDAFHVVKLGNDMVDQVRRRVQQEQLGHRGHKHDPLYEVRRLLRRGWETLSPRAAARIEAALEAGDPHWEVTFAWRCAQQLRDVYHAPTLDQGRRRAEVVLTTVHTCPIPEVARLGRTLRSWRTEFLAYVTTGGASNGPTEAINLLIEKHRRDAHASATSPTTDCDYSSPAASTGTMSERHDQNPPPTLRGVEPGNATGVPDEVQLC